MRARFSCKDSSALNSEPHVVVFQPNCSSAEWQLAKSLPH